MSESNHVGLDVIKRIMTIRGPEFAALIYHDLSLRRARLAKAAPKRRRRAKCLIVVYGRRT